ncbi:O-antigen ligase family protein [Cryomorpha ignava]|uniref:O-antigen ligase family protein n=1 Tax=Cryomorpha ignava TaxID=101383 RepID=A0A7K3WR91_9FLAO|nr:O-antigen ligase family protein [Cryomorpha ignava]NEN24048.1 O-antigen ligase family protein [Cryomorpha ignava]
MVEFISRNKVVLLLFGLWYIVGSFSVPAFFAVGGLSILLLWRKGMYFEILLGFFYILILSDNLGSATDFAKVFKNAYIVILAVIAILDRRKFPPVNPLLMYFLPFIGVALISLAFSPYIFTGFQKTLSYVLLLYTVPQLFLKSISDRGPAIVKDFIFFGIFLIVFGYLVQFVDYNFAFSHHGRFRAVFGNPNGLGIFTILIFGLAYVSREYFKELFSKADLRWIFITILLAMVLSGSRTAVIAVAMFFIMTRFYRLSPFLGFIFFLSVLFATELVTQNLVAIVEAIGLSDFFRIETLAGGSGRYIAWNFAWDAIQDNFWLGRGFAFDEWLMNKNQEFLSDLGHQGGVHNTYLIIWLNAGVIGLTLFLRALILLFIKASKNLSVAFPILWMVMFSIMLEPWLAASLNPYTIMLVMIITMMTDPLFQLYIRGELTSLQTPDEQAILA